MVFVPSEDSQRRAAAFLEEHHLDSSSLAMLESRWSIQDSRKWTRKKTGETLQRILYQWYALSLSLRSLSETHLHSSCGYNTGARQAGKKKLNTARAMECAEHTSTAPAPDVWQRKAPYDYTGCLVHAEVTHIMSLGTILRVVGYFDHNTACTAAPLKRVPAIPIHDHVYEVALRQLRQGAGYVDVTYCNYRG